MASRPSLTPTTSCSTASTASSASSPRLNSAWLDEGFLLCRVAGLDLPAALELGVEFRTEQHRDVRDPQPDEEHHDPAERVIGLVVGGEVRHRVSYPYVSTGSLGYRHAPTPTPGSATDPTRAPTPTPRNDASPSSSSPRLRPRRNPRFVRTR